MYARLRRNSASFVHSRNEQLVSRPTTDFNCKTQAHTAAKRQAHSEVTVLNVAMKDKNMRLEGIGDLCRADVASLCPRSVELDNCH